MLSISFIFIVLYSYLSMSDLLVKLVSQAKQERRENLRQLVAIVVQSIVIYFPNSNMHTLHITHITHYTHYTHIVTHIHTTQVSLYRSTSNTPSVNGC